VRRAYEVGMSGREGHPWGPKSDGWVRGLRIQKTQVDVGNVDEIATDTLGQPDIVPLLTLTARPSPPFA